MDAAKKAIEVLEHLGYEVLVPQQGCCGLAEQSNGLFETGERSRFAPAGRRQLRSAGTDLTIVSTAGSCTGMLKHEAHEILGIHDTELVDVGTRIREISEFLMELYEAGELPTDFQPINMRLPYHAPCQLKSQGIGTPASDLLRLIPGLEVVDSNVTCCGIAGTYGLKKEKYDIAQAVGKPLFDMVQATERRPRRLRHRDVPLADREVDRRRDGAPDRAGAPGLRAGRGGHPLTLAPGLDPCPTPQPEADATSL